MALIIWQANQKNSIVIIPKPIPWECLTQSKEWNFKQLLAPKLIEHPKLLSIIEDGKGNVQINFEPRKEHPRRSYSASSSNSFLEIRTPSRRSNVHSNLEEVDFSSTVPDLKYSRPDQNLQTSLDKEYLRTEAKSPNHAEKRKWFFSKLTNEQKEKFKTQWYQTMETMEMNIPIFTYFDIYAAKNNIDYPFTEISMFQKDWNTTTEKKVVSTHPPLEEITIIVQGTGVIASPFKKINPKEDENRSSNLKDIKGIQQQNNFTNQILGTISPQLDRIEKNFPKSKELTEYKKPLFKSPEFNRPIKLGNKNNDLIKILAKKVEAMNLTSTYPSTSKCQLNILSGFET